MADQSAEYVSHPCKGCGRTTVSYDDYCAMCHNGFVRPQDVGHIRWHRGVLVSGHIVPLTLV